MVRKNKVITFTEATGKEQMRLYIQELRHTMHCSKGHGTTVFDAKEALKTIKKMSTLSEYMKRQIWHDCQEIENVIHTSAENPLKHQLQLMEKALHLLEEDLE